MFFSLNSFLFSSFIRIICPFRSAIVLVPSSPRIWAYVVMIALISLIFFVNPLFSPSAFCNFSTIFSLNFIHFLFSFLAGCFPVMLGWDDPANFQFFFYVQCHNLHIHLFPLCSNLFFELFLVWIEIFYLSFGFSSRWFSFWWFYKFILMLFSGVLL